MKYDKNSKGNLDKPARPIPIGSEALQALFQHLERTLYRVDDTGETRSICDGTLLRTEAFLKTLGLWSEEARRWLERYGGYCDCEVVMNVANIWKGRL